MIYQEACIKSRAMKNTDVTGQKLVLLTRYEIT